MKDRYAKGKKLYDKAEKLEDKAEKMMDSSKSKKSHMECMCKNNKGK